MILHFVEISHANLPEISRVVFIKIRSVMMLTTRHTATARMLAMLADTTVAGRDVAATAIILVLAQEVRVLLQQGTGQGEAGRVRTWKKEIHNILLPRLRQSSRHCGCGVGVEVRGCRLRLNKS